MTADFYNKFFELDGLPDMSSSTVISKLKHSVARHGIPNMVISDNATQFTSDEFNKFTRKWNFGHETMSLGNSKVNAAGDAAVKTAGSGNKWDFF